jgi:cytochrome P450
MELAEIPKWEGVYPFERTLLSPPPQYRATQESGRPAKVRMWDGQEVWLITAYDDVRSILADNRFSADRIAEGYPQLSESYQQMNLVQKQFFISQDPPIHTRLRRMLAAEFTHAKIQSLRPMIEELVDQLTQDLMDSPQPADFFSQFALPLPSVVITKLLGIPDVDHDFFQSRSNTRIGLGSDAQDSIRAVNELRDYLSGLIAEKSKAPERYDDIMGRLIANHVMTGELTPEECMLTVDLLLLAGHETTANMATLGLLSILQHPDAAQALRDEPSPQLLKQTIEEMLRYHSIVQFVGTRVALEDVDVAGITIRKGEGVLAMNNQANRDPSRFSHPDTFDIHRKMTPHIAFGFGIHQCLGQPLARLELEIAFDSLMRRMPTLRIAAPVDELKFKKNVLVHGVYALPVAW